MNAAQFYAAFDSGWSSVPRVRELRRLAGKTIQWKAAVSVGTLKFSYATNSKTAGLLPNLPGEFRLLITWSRKAAGESRSDGISWFQYSSDRERLAFANLQRSALAKYLAQPGKEPMRSVYNYSNDPQWLPRANFDEFSYYMDASDAFVWGSWYASQIDEWCARFEAAPESFNAWCERVLWAERQAPVDG
jgi:hypothetical protein